ncbi:Peptidyl-prolyl cis-trans isomerase-like [Trichinella spiralis]|uniref:Peptidyl-prolyl cis-trans isomerase-like n=1 Tax=Trichinella spiralis TaxID=6334 RepID=A0ABR3KA12_TRISP
MSDFHRGRRHGNSRPAPQYEKMHGNPVQHRSSGQSHSDSHHRSSNSSGNRSLAKVKVSNLSPAVHKDDLRFVFQEFGKVLHIEMIVGNLLVNDICYAIIEFDSIKSAEKAVYAMNEGVLDNRLVTVEMIPPADTTENTERHKRHRM